MPTSLRALLAGLIDYAGLFPPAQLPLEQALKNYSTYRHSHDSWMLGRFIIPAFRLPEMTPLAALMGSGSPFSFSVIGRGGKSAIDFLRCLADDLALIAEFRATHQDRVNVDMLEIRLPAEVLQLENRALGCQLVIEMAELIEHHGPPALTPYLEPSLDSDWRTAVANTLLAIANLRHHERPGESKCYEHCRAPGFKLRCGGQTPAVLPTGEQVAAILVACRDHSVPFKATAGLHHPLRHFGHALKTDMHGFLNLFGAAVLAKVHGLEEEVLNTIMEDADATHFAFGKEDFRWCHLSATTSQIAQARETLASAFGSCSFDEPREDLRGLGLL